MGTEYGLPEQKPELCSSSHEIYDDGCLRVEHNNYFVTCRGDYVVLSRKEFLLISRLTRNMNRIVSAEDLWRYAWPTEKPLNRDILQVYIYKVRRRLLPLGLYIENMTKVGYSLSHGECCNKCRSLS